MLQDVVEPLNLFFDIITRQRRAFAKFFQIVIAVVLLFFGIRLLDFNKQALDLLLHLLLVALGVLGPDDLVLVAVGSEFGPINKILLKIDIALFKEEEHHRPEDVINNSSESTGAEVVDGMKIGRA